MEFGNASGVNNTVSEPILILTGVTIAADDLVRIDVATGYLELVPADGTQAYGWAINGGTGDSSTVYATVLEARSGTRARMPYNGTWATTMRGVKYGLVGGTGAQEVDLDDDTNHLFKAVRYDSDADAVWVEIPNEYSEAAGGEKEPA